MSRFHSDELEPIIYLAELRDHRAANARHIKHPHRITRHDIDGDAWITCACGWTSTRNDPHPLEHQVVKHLRVCTDGVA